MEDVAVRNKGGRPSNASKQAAARDLSDKQLAFVIWSAMPEGIRQPSTLDEFALAIGATRQSLWRWSKDPQVQDAIRFVVVQNAGDPSKVTKVLDVVFDISQELGTRVADRLKAAEVWLKATGVMSQLGRGNTILDVVDSDSGFTDFSDEQLAVMRAAAEANALEVAAMQSARLSLADAK